MDDNSYTIQQKSSGRYLDVSEKEGRGKYYLAKTRWEAQAFNDLISLVYIAAIVMVGVGLIGMAGAEYMGAGSMGRRNCL